MKRASNKTKKFGRFVKREIRPSEVSYGSSLATCESFEIKLICVKITKEIDEIMHKMGEVKFSHNYKS